MSASLPYINDLLYVFAMVLARMTAVVMTAPLFGSRQVPLQFRLALAAALTFLVTPLQFSSSVVKATTAVDFAVLLGIEVLVGLVLGIGVMLLLSAVDVAGRIISQSAGLGWAQSPDGLWGEAAPVHARFLNLVALATFVVIGGHRLIMAAVLDTFDAIPAGSGHLPAELSQTMVLLISESFRLGIRAAAPALVALLAATMVMGLVTRHVPQLNGFAVGFGLHALASLVALSASLAAIVYLFANQIEPMLQLLTGRL